MNSLPRTNAWASPFGTSCTLYENFIPRSEPSPSRRSNIGKSTGVEMISTSRMSASISVESG